MILIVLSYGMSLIVLHVPITSNVVLMRAPNGVVGGVFIAAFLYQYEPWTQTLITNATNQWRDMCQTDSKS